MSNLVHWAQDTNDMTKTACALNVGFVLVEKGDDVTEESHEEFAKERLACKDCLEDLDLIPEE